MKPQFEVFDLVSGNVLDIYDGESDAIEALIEIASDSGVGTIARFALMREHNGESILVAMGDDLVHRVANAERNLIPVVKTAFTSRS